MTNQERIISVLEIIRQNIREAFDEQKDKLDNLQNALNKLNIKENDDLNSMMNEMDNTNSTGQLFHGKLTEIQIQTDQELENLIEKVRDNE